MDTTTITRLESSLTPDPYRFMNFESIMYIIIPAQRTNEAYIEKIENIDSKWISKTMPNF